MNAKERAQLDNMLDRFMADRNKRLSIALLKAEKEEISRLATEIGSKGKIKGTKVC